MDKYSFFIKCMAIGKYKEKSWVNRAFSIVQETKTAENSTDFDIVQTAAGFLYKDPDTKGLEQITGDIKAGEPLYNKDEKISVKKGELIGFTEDVETTIGRVLYHCCVKVYPFGDKFAFENKKVSLSAMEVKIAEGLQDDVDDPKDEQRDKFYPRELLMYYEAVAYTRTFAMLFVPAATPKTMTIDPAVLKRREELFNDPSIDLNDPATAAAVEKELVQMDRDSFKGDPAEDFLIKGKDFAVTRKKRFISFGLGGTLTPDEKSTYVKTSLNEGTDMDNLPVYNNDARSGSYKRGVETMFGGELDKWLVRQSSNIQVIDDCGTTVGVPDVITDSNKVYRLGMNVVNGNSYVTLQEDNIGSYLGKSIIRRSPATCQAKAPDFCKVCLGTKLSLNPDALSIAFSQYGHDFMGLSMAAMHGSTLATARMDLFTEAS